MIKIKKKSQIKKTDIKLNQSYSEISPKIALNYRLDKNMMTYITIAKGL